MTMMNNLDWHQARLTALWEQLVHTLGVHSVNVLLDRAIWQAAQQYPDLAHIQYSDRGLSFDALAGRRVDFANEAFDALYHEMVLVLARLLGQDMARRLLEELQAERSDDESNAVQ